MISTERSNTASQEKSSLKKIIKMTSDIQKPRRTLNPSLWHLYREVTLSSDFQTVVNGTSANCRVLGSGLESACPTCGDGSISPFPISKLH